MATYLILNSIFILFIVALAVCLKWRPSKVWLLTLVLLLIMTAVFDSLIIHFKVVGYDVNKILGIYVGKAPIEDFFYAIASVILAPTLWGYFNKKDAKKDSND